MHSDKLLKLLFETATALAANDEILLTSQ